MHNGRLVSSAGVSTSKSLGGHLTLLLKGDIELWTSVEISNEALADSGSKILPLTLP